ncbi:N-acyl-aromatic-L-amino acid amidohydrolase (carboxylate-forming) B-like isoform X1 [Antennarius striatus]|uniref:N-acyl-aromatic-L-amino acid amidohydrolase (carboxylate-forming) B-like isoform X1 n=2 Tax=Antennarius striatus TaxID=241820 RepID=UPI0035AFA52D
MMSLPVLREMDKVVCLPRLSRVAVCGGTHGNELSGVYLVREMLKANKKVTDKDEDNSLSVTTLISNPLATQQCRRYVSRDLNRCFTNASLYGPVSDESPYEVIRAQELNATLGPKGSPEAVDLVCDLHNTTSCMGLCVIAYSDSDWICLQIFRHLKRQMPDMQVRYLNYAISGQEAYSLDTVGKHGFGMEIGPQPHGVVRSNIYTTMKLGVQHMLEWVRLFNSGTVFEGGPVDVFTVVQNIDYPRDPETHDITAAVHPQLQDRDFCLLRPDDPLFQTFSGETLRYHGEESLYPFFINESAYYEKNIALLLARKHSVMVPAIGRSRSTEEGHKNMI